MNHRIFFSYILLISSFASLTAFDTPLIFSGHATQRMLERGLSHSQVINAVHQGETKQSQKNIRYQYKNITVVTDSQSQTVITAFFTDKNPLRETLIEKGFNGTKLITKMRQVTGKKRTIARAKARDRKLR